MSLEEEHFSLDEMMTGANDKFYVIEEQIDIETQTSYFKHAKKAKKNLNQDKAILDFDLLNDSSKTLKQKKKILVALASVEDVQAYRLLEGFRTQAGPALKDWATLAYNESRMLLENSLSEERQIFISTGMGGKGDKLRYFMVLFSENVDGFTSFESKFVQDETRFTFEQNKSIIELIDTSQPNYIAFTVLVPIKNSLQKMIRATFENCNQFGTFINQKFIISNVKHMTNKEIVAFLNDEKVEGATV